MKEKSIEFTEIAIQNDLQFKKTPPLKTTFDMKVL